MVNFFPLFLSAERNESRLISRLLFSLYFVAVVCFLFLFVCFFAERETVNHELRKETLKKEKKKRRVVALGTFIPVSAFSSDVIQRHNLE